MTVFEKLITELFEKAGVPVTRMPVNGGAEEFSKIISRQHFAHVRVTSKEPERSM